MNCSDAERAILLDSTRELPATLQVRLREHLAGCANCRAYAADCRALGASLSAHAPDAPERIVAAVLRVADSRPIRARGVFDVYRRAILAAAAGLVLGFGVWHALRMGEGGRSQADDALTARIASISEFLNAMSHPEAISSGTAGAGTPAMDLEALADQILATQGLDADFSEEIGDVVNLSEEHRPTTLQWHNSRGLPAGRCG